MAIITQKDLSELINNRPENSTPEEIINGVLNKGLEIEGFEKETKTLSVPTEELGVGGITGIATGAAKGLGSSLFGLARVGGQISDFLLKPLEKMGLESSVAEAIGKKPSFLEPKGKAEKLGFGIEQITEFFVPIGGEIKTASTISRFLGKAPNATKKAIEIASKIGLNAADFAARETIQKGEFGEETKRAGIIGTLTSLGGLALNKSGNFLLKKAANWYQSALKPSLVKRQIGKIPEIIQTGLSEGIVLSEAGVEKVANRIDSFENLIGAKIAEAGRLGETVSSKKLKSFIEEAKQFFSGLTDVSFSKKASQEIDQLYKNFVKIYGDEIPIELAQEIKVKTGQWLHKSYGELSSPVIEGNKQLVRGLKEGILEKAPQLGDLNNRLRKLYQFDEALQKSQNRINNLNLLGIGTKVFTTGAAVSSGVVGKAVNSALAIVNEIFGRPTSKSFLAIQMNRLGGLLKNLSLAEKESFRSEIIKRFPAVSLVKSLDSLLEE